MVAKKGTTKKVKSLGAHKLTSAQAKKVKGGSANTGGARKSSGYKSWIDVTS